MPYSTLSCDYRRTSLQKIENFIKILFVYSCIHDEAVAK